MENSPISSSGIQNIMRNLTNYLEEKNIDYAIVGGIAILFYGLVRSTQYLDIIVDQKMLDISDFVSFLTNNGFHISEEDLQIALNEKSHSTIFYKDLLFRVDLKGIYSNTEQETVKTAQKKKFAEFEFRLCSPESLIVHKLVYGSERDLEDALAIFIRLKEKFDFSELERFAIMLNMEKQLEELINISEKSILEQKKWIKTYLDIDI